MGQYCAELVTGTFKLLSLGKSLLGLPDDIKLIIIHIDIWMICRPRAMLKFYIESCIRIPEGWVKELETQDDLTRRGHWLKH